MYNGLSSTMDHQIPFQVTDEFYEGNEMLSSQRFVFTRVLIKPYSNTLYKFVVELPVWL